jgi:hypothetical protein
MSELINTHDNRATIRWKLLTGASALALTAYVSSAGVAKAEDAGHPILWIEAGGAFDQLTANNTLWLAPNTPVTQTHPAPPFGTLPQVGYDADFKLSLTPNDSDWIYSVGLIYGRSLRGHKTNHDQTYNTHLAVGTTAGGGKYVYTNWNFANEEQRSTTSHMILDFQAGKDVGLGMFGGKSTLSAGIRWAKLNESASGHMLGATNATKYFAVAPYATETRVTADFLAKHSFNGIGPSVSWNSTVPFAGNASDSLSIDWGINAALLFGKQKTRTNLHTHSSYCATFISGCTPGTGSTQSIKRNKSVMVPNLGGFAGISWRLPNAKISLGYKADYFFNAIDTGVYTRKTENRGFYGPYASISVGIGD